MRVFHCDHCQNLLFFENVQCVTCGHAVAFLPDLGEMGSLEPHGQGRWRSPTPAAAGRVYRLCENYTAYDVCNWAVPDGADTTLCASCRLTQVIPDLGAPGNREAWYKLEVAKRRLIYTLLDLGLPIVGRDVDPAAGLAFEFRSDRTETVLTGHDGGVITINVAEADDAERERRRLELREPYRTLLGHMRHEIGHYYWGRLIATSPSLGAFRARFGDERSDYREALREHYDRGPREGWQEEFVTAYASVHPWEDWAETWAHYLHMADALDTASACGLNLRPRRADEPMLEADPRRTRGWRDFDELVADWFALTYVLNNLNRGLGLPDGYPFTLAAATIEKLRFVHDTVVASRR